MTSAPQPNVTKGLPSSGEWPRPKKTADGLEIALEELYVSYYESTVEVIDILLKKQAIGDWLVAEELVIKTFERVWNSLHNFDSAKGTLEGWIRIYAGRVISDWNTTSYNSRHQDTDPEWFRGLVSEDQSLDDQVAKNLLYQEVKEVMYQLNWKQRVAILLHDNYGLTYSEISHLLGEPEATWRSRASKGRRRLRGLLPNT